MIRDIRIIGIGAGSAKYITIEAIESLSEVDVFLVPDKGNIKDQLVDFRRYICEKYCSAKKYKFITIPDPTRGNDEAKKKDEYLKGVKTWRDERTESYIKIINKLPEDKIIGFLIWGDPAFYDPTIRIVKELSKYIKISVKIIPGISSIQVLAAEHKINLNNVGHPVHITPGRKLLEDWSSDLGTVVVMLDSFLKCDELSDKNNITIYWGAYLGLPQQVLRSGKLSEVIDEIKELRENLKSKHGWLMDTYALIYNE